MAVHKNYHSYYLNRLYGYLSVYHSSASNQWLEFGYLHRTRLHQHHHVTCNYRFRYCSFYPNTLLYLTPILPVLLCRCFSFYMLSNFFLKITVQIATAFTAKKSKTNAKQNRIRHESVVYIGNWIFCQKREFQCVWHLCFGFFYSSFFVVYRRTTSNITKYSKIFRMASQRNFPQPKEVLLKSYSTRLKEDCKIMLDNYYGEWNEFISGNQTTTQLSMFFFCIFSQRLFG